MIFRCCKLPELEPDTVLIGEGPPVGALGSGIGGADSVACRLVSDFSRRNEDND